MARRSSCLAVGLALSAALLLAPRALAAPPATSCAPNCNPPLAKQGTAPVVQSSPRVFAIFWGSHWEAPGFASHQRTESAVNTLLLTLQGNAGVGAQYNKILEQYLGVGKNVPTFAGEWTDPTDPPTNLQSSDMPAEIDLALGQNNWFAGTDAQFMIFPEEKNAAGQPIVVSFAGEEKPDFCGYHDHATSMAQGVDLIFDVEPFLGHSANCLATYGSGTGAHRVARAMTTVATHEYFEAATDPFWNDATKKGWTTNDAGALWEISDLCVYPGSVIGNDAALSYQYSNAAPGCVIAG